MARLKTNTNYKIDDMFVFLEGELHDLRVFSHHTTSQSGDTCVDLYLVNDIEVVVGCISATPRVESLPPCEDLTVDVNVFEI